MSQNINDALSSLHGAFHEFKSSYDEKLNTIEDKLEQNCKINEKSKKLDSIINRAETKLRGLSVGQAYNDCFIKSENYERDNMYNKQAVENYLRKGDESIINQICTKASLSSATANIGGFILPADVTENMNLALSNTSLMRSIARVTTISSDALEVLIEKTLPNAGWANETDARAETDAPEMEKIRIAVHALYAKPKASQQLLDDARIDIENWLISKIGEKIATIENSAFVSGDGTGKPKGFLSYDCVEKNAWQWGKIECIKSGEDGSFGEDGASLIIDLLNSLKTQYLQGAVWVMPRSVLAQIRKIKDKDSGRYLWTPSLESASPSTLLGYPVIIMDDMPTLTEGTASKSLAFGNFKQGYQIVDRQELQVIRDPYSAKPFVEFYATKRVGGAVVDFDAIKVLNFAA